MPSIAKKIVTNEAMQIVAIQIDYADWLKIEPLFDKSNHAQKTTANLNRFVNVTPSSNEPFPKHQRINPQAFLAEIEEIHKKLSHLPLLTDEILEMAKMEGRA
jgi:hypothetical protein